jgi:PKD repeat protein
MLTRSLTASFLTVLLFFFFSIAQAQPDVLAYAGGFGKERFNAVFELSDGTVLIGGSATSLNWIPPSVPRIVLSPDNIQNNLSTSNQFAYILHVSSDYQTILRVLHLPSGAADDITHIKTNTPIGQPTGDLFISGTIQFNAGGSRIGGYFLAKLNANFISGIPSGFTWTRSIWATGLHKSRQPWDVGADGRVVYVSGESLGNEECRIQKLRFDGQNNDLVNGWTTHIASHISDGTILQGEWTPASNNPNYVPFESMINMRSGRCSLRSWKNNEYTASIPDENGNTKQGQWPLDLFYSDSCNVQFPGSTQGGPGYTGYRRANAATPYVGGIAVDKLNNDIYIGACYQSQTSGGQPDFEPFVLAYNGNGDKKWWVRLYRETLAQSPPDQYIDGLVIDYALPTTQRTLIVLARQHGNAVNGFFAGDAIVNNPLHPTGTNTFQSRFTGTNGNIHVSWLGKYRLTDGALLYSTYVSGFFGTSTGLSGVGTVTNAPNWPNHNTGNADISDTRGEITLKTDTEGKIYVLLRTRGFTTTRNGYQQQEPPVVPSGSRDSWGDYIVVYANDLRTIHYSSMLSGEWNRTEPNAANPSIGGDNIDLKDVFPTSRGLLVVGFHRDVNNDGTPDGNAIPFSYQLNKQIPPAVALPAVVPPWGKNNLLVNDSENAVFGRLTFAKSTVVADFQTSPVNGACINSPVTFIDRSFSAAGIASWSWNFGSGASPATSTLQNPVVQWTTAGVKTIVLTVTDSNAVTSSDTLLYTISTAPNAVFTFTGATSPAPTTLNFNGPVGVNVTYLWSILNPQTGITTNYNTQNTSHLFPTGGVGTNYPVTLTVSNGFCQASTTQNISISGGPGPVNASFTANGSLTSIAVCPQQEVTFAIVNNANITSYRWFFGQNAVPSSATTQGPHIVRYATPGVQTVTLTVSNGITQVVSSYDIIVTVPATPSFTIAGNPLLVPTVLTFSASDPTATSYNWTFGTPYDTLNNTGTGFSVTNLYNIPGDYIVTLTTVTGPGCVASSTQPITIGNTLIGPFANFYFAPSGGACVNNIVTITEVATGGFSAGAPTFEWDFGQNAIPQKHFNYTPPPVRWTTPGQKIVTLRIGGSKVKSQIYTVFPYPNAGFNVDTGSIACSSPLPRLLSFRPVQAAGNVYSWDFDSQTSPGVLVSTSSSPTNIPFAIARKYAIRLLVTNNGCQSVNVQNYTVSTNTCAQPALSAGISIEPSRAGCATNEYVVRSTSTGSIASYNWTGVAITGAGPSTVSLLPGQTISLTVNDTFGASDSITVTVP